MLHKYLQFFQTTFDKLTSLGGSDSTWIDYCQTVGTELLVLFIGIVYIFTIFLIIYIPIFGNKRIIKLIRIKDKFYNLKTAYDNWRNLKKDYAKINHQIIDNEYIYTKEIKNDFEKLIRNYHLEKLVNISDFGNIGDCIKDNSFKFENQINFYNAVTLYKIIKLNWPNDWDIFKIFNNFTDKEMIIKAEHKYKFKCISACTFLLLIYLIFVIPLILMLFK